MRLDGQILPIHIRDFTNSPRWLFWHPILDKKTIKGRSVSPCSERHIRVSDLFRELGFAGRDTGTLALLCFAQSLQRADHNLCNRPLNLLFPDRPLLVAVLQFAFNEYLRAFLDTGDVRRFCGLAKEHAIMSLRDRLPFVILFNALRGRNRHSCGGGAARRVLLLEGLSGVSDRRHFVQHVG